MYPTRVLMNLVPLSEAGRDSVHDITTTTQVMRKFAIIRKDRALLKGYKFYTTSILEKIQTVLLGDGIAAENVSGDLRLTQIFQPGLIDKVMTSMMMILCKLPRVPGYLPIVPRARCSRASA